MALVAAQLWFTKSKYNSQKQIRHGKCLKNAWIIHNYLNAYLCIFVYIYVYYAKFMQHMHKFCICYAYYLQKLCKYKNCTNRQFTPATWAWSLSCDWWWLGSISWAAWMSRALWPTSTSLLRTAHSKPRLRISRRIATRYFTWLLDECQNLFLEESLERPFSWPFSWPTDPGAYRLDCRWVFTSYLRGPTCNHCTF